MNKDLIIGLVVSIAFHLITLNPFAGKMAAPKRVAPPKEEAVQFEMPPMEEEKEEKVEDLNDEPVENQLAPPSLVDLPTVVPVTAFTQPLQPPPPSGADRLQGRHQHPGHQARRQFRQGHQGSVRHQQPRPAPGGPRAARSAVSL